MISLPLPTSSRVFRFVQSGRVRATGARCRIDRKDGTLENVPNCAIVLFHRMERFGTILVNRTVEDASLPSGSTLAVELTGDQSPVPIVSAEWIRVTRKPIHIPRVPRDKVRSNLFAAERMLDAAEPDDIRSWSLQMTGGMLPDKEPTDKLWHAAWLFFHLDVQTNERLFNLWHAQFQRTVFEIRSGEISYRQEAIRKVMGLLGKRLRVRQLGRTPTASGLNSSQAAMVAYLSRIQLEVFDRFYAWRSKGVHHSGLERAFECFASGELLTRVHWIDEDSKDSEYPLNEAAPDGPSIFMFAEFAMLAIELGIDACEWAALLPLLDSVQEIYWHAYGKHPQRQSISSYSHRRDEQNPLTVNTQVLEELRSNRRRFLTFSSPDDVSTDIGKLVNKRLRAMFSDEYKLGRGTWGVRADNVVFDTGTL